MNGVLVGSSSILDELETVAGLARSKISLWSPEIEALVWNLFSDWVQRDDIGRWSLEKDDSDSSFRGWVPCDIEGLADWDELAQSWSEGWVRTRVKFSWLGGGKSRRRKSEEDEKNLADGVHFELSDYDGLAVTAILENNNEWTTTTKNL